MKKIPYALGMLAAYLVLEFVVLRSDALGTVQGKSGLELLTGIVLLVGPILLGLLILANTERPMSGVAGILCLVMSVCSGVQVVDQFASDVAQMGSEVSGADARGYLWLLAGSIFLTVLLWIAGSKLQDGDTGTLPRPIALIGCAVLFVQVGEFVMAGIYPTHAYFPHLVAGGFAEMLLLLFVAELPTVLNQVGSVGARRLTWKRALVLAGLTAAMVGLWIITGRV